MKQEMCVLPVQCNRCRVVFDLWYDLQGEEISENIGRTGEILASFKESLCWKCRQAVLEGLGEVETEKGIDAEEVEEFLMEFE